MDGPDLLTVLSFLPSLPLSISVFAFNRRNKKLAWVLAALAGASWIISFAYFAISAFLPDNYLGAVVVGVFFLGFLPIGPVVGVAAILLDEICRRLLRPLPVFIGYLTCAAITLAIGMTIGVI